jgi:allantoinase
VLPGKASGVAYSAIVERPVLTWPRNAAVAVWVALNIEHYQYVPPVNQYIRAWPRVPQPPDTMMYGYYDFANRVGLWRVLELIDEFAIPVTASLNMAVLDRYPEISEAIRSRGWDVMCHGRYNTEYLFGLEEQDERQFFIDVVESSRRNLGCAPAGFFGPAGSITSNTMDLAAEHGFAYTADWGIDDQPVPVSTKHGTLISVPYGFNINDDALMALGYGGAGIDGDDFLRMAIDQCDALRHDGRVTGRVMCIALHGYVFGQPHRTVVLRRLLEYLADTDDVWLTTGGEIASHYLTTVGTSGRESSK